MYQVNKLRRNYQKGKPLPTEIRTQILQNAPYCTYRTLPADNLIKYKKMTVTQSN